MRICHVSDTHGRVRNILKSHLVDVYVLSGDIAPNLSYPNSAADRKNDALFQQQWYHTVSAELLDIFQGKPVVCLDGNHDFYPVADGLRSIGVNVYEVDRIGVEVQGVRFAGFPNIPWIGGSWNHEARESHMSELIQGTLSVGDPDVLVTHSPPAGILDMTVYRENVGSRPITNALLYNPHNVRAHLFGHIHESAGTTSRQMGSRKVLFSNAATTHATLEVHPRS